MIPVRDIRGCMIKSQARQDPGNYIGDRVGGWR